MSAGAPPSWRELYGGAVERLGPHRRPEARWMVEEVSGARWTTLLDSQAPVPDKARERLVAMVERRRAGEPLQYVLGRWGFRTLDLMVDRRVLIPRPETEQVVEAALAELDRVMAAGPNAGSVVAVDLGTGSGAVALSLAAERTGVSVWGADASAAALAVAQANLSGMAGHAATRVRLVEGSWWSALPTDLAGSVSLVVSNPPYVSTAEMGGLDVEVSTWEPREALEAGPTGIEAVEEILTGAPAWLVPGGAAVLEIAPHQSGTAQRIAGRAGFSDAFVRQDLAGRDRVLVARMAP